MPMGISIYLVPTNSLSSGSGQQVIANPTTNTTYMLVAVDSCSVDTVYFRYDILTIFIKPLTILSFVEDSLILNASGGIIYRWSGLNITNVDSANPTVSPQLNSMYYVDIT